MNRKQLIQRLQSEKVPQELYSLDGGLPHDRHCLDQTSAGWEVYYSERGHKFHVEAFATEEEACERLYQKIQRTVKYS